MQTVIARNPEFAEATAIYGLNNTFTLYGGLLGSEDYYALGIGIGGTLGALGALSMDINRADTQFDNQHSFHGYQWRTQTGRYPKPLIRQLLSLYQRWLF